MRTERSHTARGRGQALRKQMNMGTVQMKAEGDLNPPTDAGRSKGGEWQQKRHRKQPSESALESMIAQMDRRLAVMEKNCRKLTSWPDCLASCRPTSHVGLAALRRIVLGLKVLLVLLVCRYFPLMSLQASFFHKVSRQAPTLRICNLALE